MKIIAISFAIASIAAVGCIAQNNRASSIESLMSAAEFRAAGLHKLSGEELRALDRWLTKYGLAILSAADSSATTPPRATGEVIESHIAGEFEGWSGDTIFKLDNGQIWQQSSYSYTYHYAYRPEVLIYRSGGVYKMKVEDVEDTITVKRLR
jgi:hypothetical protein